MANTMGPEEMLINQIELLTAEEEKLERLYQTYSNKKKVKMHLDEVRSKKSRLYKLCSIMGVSNFKIVNTTFD
ncbi:hypothetical protein [Fulvivirga sediminis]|uniref:Uncharacterized protein n=1 Tax=Fulvivirga sediminis TaxID=2803949 RepID=A0A937F8N4_9BACT|nr:hypothetical protein [Fulvivirga sediminis]MBL3658356.1 hypothetical protein [Fulvivirga sediminis]